MKKRIRGLFIAVIMILCVGQMVYASEPKGNLPDAQSRQGEEVLNPDTETNGTLIPEQEKVYRFQVSQSGYYRFMIYVGDTYGGWQVSVEDETGESYGTFIGSSDFDGVFGALKKGKNYLLKFIWTPYDGEEHDSVSYKITTEMVPGIEKVTVIDPGRTEYIYKMNPYVDYYGLNVKIQYKNGKVETLHQYETSIYGTYISMDENYKEDEGYSVMPGTYTTIMNVYGIDKLVYSQPMQIVVKDLKDAGIQRTEQGTFSQRFSRGYEQKVYEFTTDKDGTYRFQAASATEKDLDYNVIVKEAGVYGWIDYGPDNVFYKLKKGKKYYLAVQNHHDSAAVFTLKCEKVPHPVWIEILEHANNLTTGTWPDLYHDLSIRITYDNGEEKVLKYSDEDTLGFVTDGQGNMILQTPENSLYDEDGAAQEGIHTVTVQLGYWNDGRPYPQYDVSAKYQVGVGVTAPELEPEPKPDFTPKPDDGGKDPNGGAGQVTPPVQTDLSKAAVKVKASVVYNKKAQKPSVTVTLGNKTLKKDTDYTVVYQNNKQIGTAKVKVTGKGAYKGSKEASFKILPSKPTLVSVKSPAKKQVKAVWKRDKQVTGYEVYFSYKKSSGYKKTTIKKNKTVSLKKKGMKSKKTCYVKLRSYKKVNGVKYLSGYSRIRQVRVK